MKTNLIVAVFLVVSVNLFAQSDYEKAVIQNLESLGSAQSLEDMVAVANKFERIAVAESNEWLPRYYASYINIILSFKTQDIPQKQKYLDFAQQQLDEATKINSEESEIHTLQGMLYQAYIMLNPMANGQIYSGKAHASFNDAKKLNPNNPRPYYLEALNIMHTPEEYGGGKKAALPLLSQASELFLKFKPVNGIMPSWGEEDCEKQLQTCKEGI
jgi:hypothetical protein